MPGALLFCRGKRFGMPAKPASTKSLAQKLLLKPGMSLVVINAPANYEELLGPLPEGVTLKTSLAGRADALHLFVRTRAEVTALIKKVAPKLTADTLLWLSYPKKTSELESELSRDEGWDAADDAGLETVAAIAVDDDWSALRFMLIGPRAPRRKAVRKP